MVLLESEGPGHSTTAGVENLVIETELRQDRFVGLIPHDGLVMTVALDERMAVEWGELVFLGVLGEKLTQRERLLMQALRIFIMGKKIDEFIAKDGSATRFQANHGHTSSDLRLKSRQIRRS